MEIDTNDPEYQNLTPQQKRRRREAVKKARKKQNESEQQRIARRARLKLKEARKKAHAAARGDNKYKQKDSQKKLQRFANETPERRAQRISANAKRVIAQREKQKEDTIGAIVRRSRNAKYVRNCRNRLDGIDVTVNKAKDAARHANKYQNTDNVSKTIDAVIRNSRRAANQALLPPIEKTAERQKSAARRTKSRAQIRSSKIQEKAAFSYDVNFNYSKLTVIGGMEHICEICNAKKFKTEKASLCCMNGKTKLEPLQDTPELIKDLLTKSEPLAKHFRANTRAYNSAFSMTSFGADVVRQDGFSPTFTVQGQVYHRLGSLLPQPDSDYQFVQLYFVSDMTEQAKARQAHLKATKLDVLLPLQQVLHANNPYVRDFKRKLQQSTKPIRLLITEALPPNMHKGRFNKPQSDEVAVILTDKPAAKRDIIVETRSNTLKRVSELHRSYDPLQYPLIHAYGQDGYSLGLPVTKIRASKAKDQEDSDTPPQEQKPKTITCLSFYAYRLMVREGQFNCLQRYFDLFQQYLVDQFAKVESERLCWVRTHQKELRSESYSHLKDALSADKDASELGRRCILPSTHTGSPRYMHERAQDAMTYVREFGRPDLFITFTCNPKWEEITENLFEFQTAKDRPDIVARVFHEKLKKMLDLILKHKIFGSVRAFVYTVEWQKRGLPHAHSLFWLLHKVTSDQIDNLISAEIPDEKFDPELFDIVKSTMVHGPCGLKNPESPCMDKAKGLCSKRFPKDFIEETQSDGDGYPLYRRRSPDDGGHTFELKVRGVTHVIDNRWIVPYNPLLLRAFGAHINMEVANSVRAIKYVCKYIYKGTELATFKLVDSSKHDEVTAFEVGRYISSHEASWRLFSFPVHGHQPHVEHLNIHLENGERVMFKETTSKEKLLTPKCTKLTAFFKLCASDEFAKTLLYTEVPRYYTWKSSAQKWVRRQRGSEVQENVFKSDSVARMYSVNPHQQECFFLRLLLTRLRGPTSFDSIKTVDGIKYESYRATCTALGMLESDSIWLDTMADAAEISLPEVLRDMFVVMLLFCSISSPLRVWEKFSSELSEDIHFKLSKKHPRMDVKKQSENEALRRIEHKLSMSGKSLSDFELPKVDRSAIRINFALEREMNYDSKILKRSCQESKRQFNSEQKNVFQTVLRSVKRQDGKLFFLDAPGGTGKTFILQAILAEIRSSGEVALAVASSGIAATMLDGARTAHSVFKLPLNIHATDVGTSSITRDSDMATVIERAKIVIWDEATMSHRSSLEAVDMLFQDVCRNTKTMGGKTVVLSGDFRQCLPVVQKGTKADQLRACIKKSSLWKKTTLLSLRENMRCKRFGLEAQRFSNDLLSVGNGQEPHERLLENLGNIVKTREDLILRVFPQLETNFQNVSWLQQRALLATTNAKVDELNDILLSKLAEKEHVYRSIDTTVSLEDAVHYPVEFLNSLNPSGVPPHELKLKVGVPIIILRNLNPPRLCNGSRCIVTSLKPNVIEARPLKDGDASTVYIPRIPIIPSDVPFRYKRVQFPVRVCFAMTINKAQGQTFQSVGLDLEQDPFSHGQLYVGLSRVGQKPGLFLYYGENESTKNIVYQEALI